MLGEKLVAPRLFTAHLKPYGNFPDRWRYLPWMHWISPDSNSE